MLMEETSLHIGQVSKMESNTKDREKLSRNARVSHERSRLNVPANKRLLAETHARRRIADNKNILHRIGYPSTSPRSSLGRGQQSGMPIRKSRRIR